MSPVVTFVVCARNDREVVGECLEVIAGQTVCDHECILAAHPRVGLAGGQLVRDADPGCRGPATGGRRSRHEGGDALSPGP